MKKYYLAADGGGTKLQAVLYDQDLQIVRLCRATGVNTLFKPLETVRSNINTMVAELLQTESNDPVTEIAAADLCLVGPADIMQEALTRNCQVNEFQFHSEPQIGLGAAFKSHGAVTLSGTGSDAFFIGEDDKIRTVVGGWGALLGDEGSGYDIGLNTLKAAIYAYDGRREKTVLYDMVMDNWKLSKLWDIVTLLSGNPEARHEVASAAKICAKAANIGDPVALHIYEKAANELFIQTRMAIEPNRKDWDGTTVIMGGAWKGCPHMLDTFRNLLTEVYPEANVIEPVFEPVAGAVVRRFIREGYSTEYIQNRLQAGFQKLLYQTER